MNKATNTMPYLSGKSTSVVHKLLIIGGLLCGLAMTTGCQTTGQRESQAQHAGAEFPVEAAGAYRIGTVTGSPQPRVYGGELDAEAGTKATLMDVLRGKGRTIAGDNVAARYEVNAAWKSPSEGVETKERVLEVTVVDLNNGNTVYSRTSEVIDGEIMGQEDLRNTVESALSGLRR